MSLLHARYVVHLEPTHQENVFDLERIGKTGEGYSSHLNNLFAHRGNVTFKRLNPPGIADDYILSPLIFGKRKNNQTLLLESMLTIYPYGTVDAEELKDCILFRISGEQTIEFFVSMGNANMTTQLLTMFVEGSLEDEIDNLLV